VPPLPVDSTTDVVRIHYRRLPDREDEYVQRVIARTDAGIVTFTDRAPLPAPVMIHGAPALEPDAPAIWFTFPGAWHDIGLFHLRDGTFTGIYANAITPVRFLDARTWETTDLFLDAWLDPDGQVTLLDEDELERALVSGAIDAERAGRARSEMDAVIAAARLGAWPPRLVRDWPLERVRALAP